MIDIFRYYNSKLGGSEIYERYEFEYNEYILRMIVFMK